MSTNYAPGLHRADILAVSEDSLSAAHGGTADGLHGAIQNHNTRKADREHAVMRHREYGTVFDAEASAPYDARVSKTGAVVASLQQKLADLTAQSSAVGAAAGRCEKWRSALGDAKPTVVAAKASINLEADAAALADLTKQMDHIAKRSIVPDDQAHNNLDINLDRKAQAPRVLADGRIQLPHHVLPGQVDGVVNAEALLLWLGGDELRALLHKKLDEARVGLDKSLVMDSKSKAATLAKLRGQHLDLQRRISEGVWKRIAAGDESAVLFFEGIEAGPIMGLTA